jgi:curved DNA-binding protein CbpA
MFYSDVLDHLMRDKKNPVNQMYLHEIELMWKEVQKAIALSLHNGTNDDMVIAINKFTEIISNPKYRYDKFKKKGFHYESQLFQPQYIADLLTIFFERTGILDHYGIKWGFQRFDQGPKYSPRTLLDNEKKPHFTRYDSNRYPMLTRTMEFQYRIEGRRNFERSEQVFPLLVFGLFGRFDPIDMTQCEAQARLAKEAFPQCKFIVITETLRENFVPEIDKSDIDILFVLRKQYFNKRKKTKKIALDVMNVLEKKIVDYLNFNEIPREDIFRSRGMLEK